MKVTKLLTVILLTLLLLTLGGNIQACDLLREYPHYGAIRLSNGASVPIPTHSLRFDSYSIYGLLNFEKTREILNSQGLYPIKVGDRAVGVFSVFDYKESDLGPFREAYFVILATPRKYTMPVFSIFKLLDAFSWSPSAPNRDLGMYHEKVWSSTENAQLSSKEIWGIPSTRAEIKIQRTKGVKISLSEEGARVFNIIWSKLPNIPSAVGHNFFVYAVGPNFGGLQKWSPVKSCGESFIKPVSKKDGFEIFDSELNLLLSNLEFSQVLIEWSENQKAVQLP